MKKHLFILILTLTCTFAHAQNYGFMGRKNLLTVKTVSNVPVLANLLDAFYDGPHYFHRWRFGALNTGIHLSLGRMIKQNVALSIEGGYDFLSYKNYDEDGSQYGKTKQHCLSIMPKIEFSGSKTSFPIGFSHQLGIGYYSLGKYLNYKGNTFVYAPLQGVTLMYAMMLRSAISKRIMLNYGVRYTLNYTFTGNGLQYRFEFDNTYEIYYQKRLNLVSLELGLTYAF